MDLSQLGINTDNTALKIPGLENLQSMFQTVMVGSAIIGGLFLVLYIINLIQRMRADRAMIAMHKDIAAIRALLEHNSSTPKQSETPAPATPVHE